jgi:hypothetical protein
VGSQPKTKREYEEMLGTLLTQLAGQVSAALGSIGSFLSGLL